MFATRAVAIRWRVAALAVVALAFTCVLPATEPDHEGWNRLESEGLTVFHREEDARPAARILEVALERGPLVARGVGIPDIGQIEIFVASTEEEYGDLTSHGVPDWGVGCAFPERGVVVLKSPLIVTYPLQMEDVVVHEIAHVAAGRVLGSVWVPRWFHEGVAMTLAGEWRLPDSGALAGAGPGGKLMPLSELSAGFPEGREAAALAYAESFYAVRFLMSEAGLGSAGELLREIVIAGGFDEGVRAMYGRGVDEFERDAVKSFRGRFSWGVFLTRWNVLWAALTLLVLAAGVTRIARARRKVAEWEAEAADARSRRRSSGRRDSGWR